MKTGNVFKAIGVVTVGCLAANAITSIVKGVTGIVAIHKTAKELNEMMGENVFEEDKEA